MARIREAEGENLEGLGELQAPGCCPLPTSVTMYVELQIHLSDSNPLGVKNFTFEKLR